MMSAKKRKCLTVRAKVADVAKFSDTLSPDAAEAAAVILGGMRKLAAATGPGHVPLDVVTSVLPEAYRRNWAKKQLGKAA